MIKSRIIDLLKTFTPGELKRFEIFVKSEYFNTNQSAVAFIRILARFYPDFTDPKLTKEKIFKTIYGDRVYNDGDIRKLLYDLYHLAEGFIVVEKMANEKLTDLNILLEELLSRNLISQYIKTEKEFDTNYKNIQAFEEGILLELFRYEKTKFNFADKNQYIKNSSIAIDQISILNKSNEYLFIHLIRHFITCFINNVIQRTKYEYEDVSDFTTYVLRSLDFDKLLNYFRSRNKLSYLFELYQMSYRLFNEFEHPEHYSELKLLIRKHYRKLGNAEKNYFSTICISYCILKSRHGSNDIYFDSELFNLYNEYLQNKLYLISGEKYRHIPLLLFYAILTNGINLKKLDWSLNFVMAYSKELAPLHRENMRNFGLALIYSRTNNYSDALTCANKIEFSNFIFKYVLRNLMLRIYIELGYINETISLIHSYKEFMKKDKLLNKTEKLLYSKFVSYIEKLIKFKDGSKKIVLENVLAKINNDDKFYSKNWLIRKYEEEILKNLKADKIRKTI